MGFPKVERVALVQQSLSGMLLFFCSHHSLRPQKKCIIHHPAMDFEYTGSMWHRMVARLESVATAFILLILKNKEVAEQGIGLNSRSARN